MACPYELTFSFLVRLFDILSRCRNINLFMFAVHRSFFHLAGKVAYELRVPNKLASVHLVFHVSILKKCIGDPVSIIPIEGLGVDENLSYE